MSEQQQQRLSLETFRKYQERWTEQQHRLLRQLRAAQERRKEAIAGERPVREAEEELKGVVTRLMGHCREYHSARRSATEEDVVAVLASEWSSPLERSLQWVGGWRPTTAFHLVYTESSILFESRVVDILRGYHTGDLSDLCPLQFRRVNEMQCDTVREENKITEELSEWQDDAAEVVAGTEAELSSRLHRLRDIVNRADDLRLASLTGIVSLLSPLQAAEFLSASSDLYSGIRGWATARRSSPA